MYFALAHRMLGSGFDQVTTRSDKAVARHFHPLKQKYEANITKPHCRGLLVPFIDFYLFFFLLLACIPESQIFILALKTRIFLLEMV